MSLKPSSQSQWERGLAFQLFMIYQKKERKKKKTHYTGKLRIGNMVLLLYNCLVKFDFDERHLLYNLFLWLLCLPVGGQIYSTVCTRVKSPSVDLKR